MLTRALVVALSAALALTFGGLTAPAQASAPLPGVSASAPTSRLAPRAAAKPSRDKRTELGQVSAKSFDSHWWGLSWTLTNNGTKTLVYYLKIGSGVSTIVALLCGGSVVGVACGVAYGLAAIVLVLGGDYLDRCNKGSGVVIKKPWVGVPFCTSR